MAYELSQRKYDEYKEEIEYYAKFLARQAAKEHKLVSRDEESIKEQLKEDVETFGMVDMIGHVLRCFEDGWEQKRFKYRDKLNEYVDEEFNIPGDEEVHTEDKMTLVHYTGLETFWREFYQQLDKHQGIDMWKLAGEIYYSLNKDNNEN